MTFETTLLNKLQYMVRIGTVTQINVKRNKVRVQTGAHETAWLDWLSRRAGNVTEWMPPTIGEGVVILSPDGNLSQGLVIGSFYTEKSKESINADANTHHIQYADGTSIIYDQKMHSMTLNCVGKVEVKAKEIIASAKTIKANAKAVDIKAGTAKINAKTVNLTGTQNVSINSTGTVNLNGASGVNITAPGIGMTCTGEASIKVEGKVNLDARELKLGGNRPVACVGDTVSVVVTGGSSAGRHNGTITSGSSVVKAK